MDMADFKKLQQTQMQIMDEVHRVCLENNICYYIIGGTALGAKRHGGFIPWDLDIDIAMPREDYERFAKISNDKLSPKFSYRDYRNTKSFIHPHALVCMNDTSLVLRCGKFNPQEDNWEIYLDIFPLDVAPVETDLQEKQAEDIRKIKKLKLLKRGYNYSGNPLKIAVKKTISKLIFWTSIDKLNYDLDTVCRKYENSDSPYICSMTSRYKYTKQCMDKSIYGEPQLVKYEDREYYAPEKLEDYLTAIYGDYMKLPPESDRKVNLKIFESVKFADD